MLHPIQGGLFGYMVASYPTFNLKMPIIRWVTQ